MIKTLDTAPLTTVHDLDISSTAKVTKIINPLESVKSLYTVKTPYKDKSAFIVKTH